MIPYLRAVLIHLWVACIAGAGVILGLALGAFSVSPFVWAAVAGVFLSVPAALLNWAYLPPNRSRQIGCTWKIADWARAA